MAALEGGGDERQAGGGEGAHEHVGRRGIESEAGFGGLDDDGVQGSRGIERGEDGGGLLGVVAQVLPGIPGGGPGSGGRGGESGEERALLRSGGFEIGGRGELVLDDPSGEGAGVGDGGDAPAGKLGVGEGVGVELIHAGEDFWAQGHEAGGVPERAEEEGGVNEALDGEGLAGGVGVVLGELGEGKAEAVDRAVGQEADGFLEMVAGVGGFVR